MKHYVFYENALFGKFACPRYGSISLGDLPSDCYIYREDGTWFYYDFVFAVISHQEVPPEIRALALILT